MRLRRWTGLWAGGWVFGCLSAVSAAQASLTVYDLGAPVVSAAQARIPVAAAFTPDHGDSLVSILLNVAGSSPVLTAGGADYSRFAFVLDGVIEVEWDAFGTPFQPPGVAFAQFDTFGPGLGAGTHPLGELLIDLTGLPAGIALEVRISDLAAFNPTSAVSQVPGQPVTADLTDVAFATDDQGGATFRIPGAGPGAIPEPVTAASALLVMAAAATAALRRSPSHGG